MPKEFDFVSYCPVLNCPNGNTPLYWKHYKCLGKTTINDLGQIRCRKCDEIGPVIDWLFRCEHHDFQPANFQKISFVLSTVQQILDVEDDDFFMDMVDAVKVQYRKRKQQQKTSSDDYK
jgi:hypothetical protein